MTTESYKLEQQTTIILPTLNECDNTAFWALLDNIIMRTDCKIIIVDDGNDKLLLNLTTTYYQKEIPDRINYIKGKKGESESIEHALRKVKTPYTVIMDSDGSHPFEFILRYLGILRLTKSRILVGTRYGKDGYTKATFLNKTISKISNKFATWFLGIKSTDVTGRLLAGPTKKFLEHDVWFGHGDAGMHFLAKTDTQILDLGITYEPRIQGKGSTDSIKGILKYLLHYFIRLLYIKVENKLPFTARWVQRAKADSWSIENYKITYTTIFSSILIGISYYIFFKPFSYLPGTTSLINSLSYNSFTAIISKAYWDRKLARCGQDTIIHKNVQIHNPERLKIGKRSIIDADVVIIVGRRGWIRDEATIHRGSYINGRGGFIIGNKSCIGHYTLLFSDTNISGGSFSYATRPHDQVIDKGSLKIRDNVYVGAQSTIINCELPTNTIVGAQSFMKDNKLINGKITANWGSPRRRKTTRRPVTP